MTTLAVVGDIHAHQKNLKKVLAAIEARGCDGLLLVGDLGSNALGWARRRTPERDARYLASLDEVFSRVEALGRPWAFVPGNHDLPDLAHPANVDHTVAVVAGLRVAGVGGAGPDRFGFCYEWSEDAIRARSVPPCDVLLVHCPPKDTPLDHVPGRDTHVGSAAIRELALAHEGFLVCGHIHESPGAVQLGRCLCLNAGGLGRPFGRPQVGFLERDAAGDRVQHVDLTTGETRTWTREVSP